MRRITVVGAVIVRDGRILAARRGPKMSLAGLWEFPGGKVEPGEDPREALAREICEELDCSIVVNDYITVTDYQYDFGIVSLSTYYCELTQGEPVFSEHSEISWLLPEELLQLEWAPADIPAVKKIKEDLGENAR